MKATQFLYQNIFKEQQDSKAKAIKKKSKRKLKLSNSLHKSVDNQSEQKIYSLVNLTVKDGQNEKVQIPAQLISRSSKVKHQNILNKTMEIARTLKKLKPLSTLDASSELIQVQQGKSIDQQFKGPKKQVYLKQINILTDGQYKKTQTYLLFGSIEQKINQNTVLCILRIQNLKFFNDYNSKNHNNPALFSWEVLYRKQSLMKSLPKEYQKAQTEILDFVYTRNGHEIVEVVLWKVKNNDEKYVGQFDIINDDYVEAKKVLNYQKKVITENLIEKEMFKSMKQTKSYIGNVQFQIIQFGNENIIQIKNSGNPGSPKNEKEKTDHRIIDQVMQGQQYKWNNDENEQIVSQNIEQITSKIVPECTVEVLTIECGQLVLIYEQKYNNPELYGRSRPNSRQIKKQNFDANMALLYELNRYGQFTKIQTHLRSLSRQGRLSRKVIEESLYEMKCTANQLFLTECIEFGDNLMDFLIFSDDLLGILEAIQEIKFLGEEELNLEGFSNNLFQLIGQHLRKNTKLKSIIYFIKALEKKPEIGILIQNYSYATENILSNKPPFLNNFNPKNYEHIMVLGKLNKMIQKFQIDTKFTRALKQAHIDTKMSIYFDIPCFPKDQNLFKKAESLQLKQIGQNIIHEIVRRQKWEKSHQIFQKYSEWFFVADFQGITPFSNILEIAPFQVLQSLFNAYKQQLNVIFQQFNPYKDMFIGNIPKQESNKNQEDNQKQQSILQNTTKEQPFQWAKMQKEYRKNILHNVILNPNFTANEILEILISIEQFVNLSNKSNFSILKTQKIRAGDFTPLALYLEILGSKCKKKLDRVQREFGTYLFICQKLIPDQDEIQGEQIEQEQKEVSFVWDIDNQFIIQSLISKLPESLFQQIDFLFPFIQWIPPLEKLKTIRYINLPCRLLIKNKQQQKLIIILQQMYNDVKKQEYYNNSLESDEILLILYYFQIQILMLLEIRNQKAQYLENVQNLIVRQLKDFIQSYTEILVISMPINIISSYYELKYFYKGKPQTLLEFLNLVQFNTLITEIEIKNLDRLDTKLLGKALSNSQNKEPLKDLIQFLLIKDQNKDETEKYNYDSKEFSIIINPNLLLDEKENGYRYILNKEQIEKLMSIAKADQILQLVCDNSKFSRIVHGLILNSFQTKKSIGITQIQILHWFRNYDFKISNIWKKLYIDYFRNKMDLYCIHCLLDIEYLFKNKACYNYNQLLPYINAQGRSWAAILDYKRFKRALKDNIQFIDIENAIRAVAINGQYDKLEILIPHIKDSQILRQTIQLVSIIAERQMIQQYNADYFFGRLHLSSFEDILFSDDEEENQKQPKRTIQSNLNKQELKKLVRDRLDLPGKLDKSGFINHLKILGSHFIYRFDLISTIPKNSSKKQKEKLQAEKFVFPETLDQIRNPISIQNQLLEMDSNIQQELESYKQKQYPKPERINLLKFEQQFEKYIYNFQYLKSLKSSTQRQSIRTLFSQDYYESDKYSFKKVLIQLTNEYKKYKVPLCQKDEDYEIVLKMLAYNKIITIDEFIKQILSSKIDIQKKNNLLLELLNQLLNCKNKQVYEQYQLQNQEIFLQLIPLIIKNLRILEESNLEQINNLILNRINLILKRFKPIVLNPLSIYKQKLVSEILMNLYQSKIKDQFQDQLKNIAQTIRERNLSDKILQSFASYYLKEKDKILKKKRLTHNEIIMSFKKKQLNEVLQKTDLINYVSNFSDKNCQEIFKELFKLPWDQKFKNDILSKFDGRLFESLIFYRRYKAYDTLIHEILFKKICNQDEGIFKQKITEIESYQIQTIQPQNDKMQQEDKTQQKEENKQFSLSQMAAQFSFYEYYDTLHRLNIKVKEIEPFPSIRFMLETNNQLQILAVEYEKKELNYISNCIKMMRYLRLNHYDTQTFYKNFESELMFSFIVEDISTIEVWCLNIIKLYLIMNRRPQPFWQDSIIRSKYESRNYQFFNKKNIIPRLFELSLIKLKINGVEKGVKFCFPSNYDSESDQYSISTEDINQTQTKKPIFSLDEYIDCLDKNDPLRLENQILNDPNFQSILNKLLVINQNQEFLVDKINIFTYLKYIVSHNQIHEMQYYLLNFPLFWYDQKIPKENLIINTFFLNLELGLVFFKSLLIFEPQLLDQILDIYFSSLMEFAKEVDQEGNEYNNDNEKKEENQFQFQDYKSQSDLEPYEDEETDKEEENQQELQQDDKIEDSNSEAYDQQISEQNELQEPPKIKKKRKVIKYKPKDYIEPLKGLRRQLQLNCPDQIRFQIYIQLLFLATTNEESFQLIQKYLIQYQSLPPLQEPKEINFEVQSRLLEQGYQEPYNEQFIQQIESNINTLSQQQIEDIQHVKEIIKFNQNLKETKYSKVYQFLITQIYKTKYSGFQNIIDNLLRNPAYSCLIKQKNNIFMNSLQNDKQFQEEIIIYHQQNRKVNDENFLFKKIQMNRDFIDKFFQGKSNQQFTNDKWIHILCLFKYCQELEKQFIEFDQNEGKTKLQVLSLLDDNEVSIGFEGYIQKTDTFNVSYCFKFLISDKFTPITYQHTKKQSEKQKMHSCYFFNFDITINILRSKNPNNPFPIVYLYSKIYDELDKIFRIFMFDYYIDVFLLDEKKNCQEMQKLCEDDFIDSYIIKQKLNIENYQQLRNIQQVDKYYLNEIINSFQDQKKDRLNLIQYIQKSEEQPDGIEIDYQNKKNWIFINPRIQKEINIQFQDKLQTLPFSNYKPRIQKQLNQKIQIDLTFPELYPVTSLQVYKYIPVIITQEEQNQKYDSLSLLQFACVEINTYTKLLNDFLTKLPSNDDEIDEFLENPKPRNVYWPLVQKKNNSAKGYSHKFKYTYIIETIPLYLMVYLFQNLNIELDHEIKFTLNCLSFTEIILSKLIRIIQQSTGKKCKIATAISILKQWIWFKKILINIGELIIENDINKFKAYYVEINEINPNEAFNLKYNKLEGMDSLFRFGKTQYFVHSGVLIIRLNIALVSENLKSKVNLKSIKLNQIQSDLFSDDKDLIKYMQFIVTPEEILKCLLSKN